MTATSPTHMQPIISKNKSQSQSEKFAQCEGALNEKNILFIPGEAIDKSYFPILVPVGVTGNILSFIVSIIRIVISIVEMCCAGRSRIVTQWGMFCFRQTPCRKYIQSWMVQIYFIMVVNENNFLLVQSKLSVQRTTKKFLIVDYNKII